MIRASFTKAATAAGLVFLSACGLAAQAAPQAASDAERVFAPFVSRIAAVEKEGTVSLTWLDSRDAAGSVFVFRSKTAIDAAALSGSKPLAEVPFGAQSFIDKPPEASLWHYFIAASDDTGRRFDVVLPYGNSIDVRVGAPAASAAKQPAPAPAGIAAAKRISGVAAEVKGDSVRVSFRADPSVSNVLVYRSASALTGMQDLLDAVIVQAAPAGSEPVVDYPVPGIGYYYALVPEEDLKTGRISIEPGINATTVPVEVPAGRYRVGLPGPPSDIRSMPLPLISLDAAMPTGSVGPQPPANPVELSPAAAKAVAELIKGAKPAKFPERRPRAFPQDLETPSGGEEYALRSIVQGPFAKKDWTESARQIARYLSLSRSPASEARAHYYLGQSFFFSGRYSEALFEFLLAQSQYYAEGQEWIDAILPRLRAGTASASS